MTTLVGIRWGGSVLWVLLSRGGTFVLWVLCTHTPTPTHNYEVGPNVFEVVYDEPT